jgi:hypothetical protein
MTPLLNLLRDFAVRVNDHPGLRRPLAGWSPAFYIEASDTGHRFQVHMAGGHVEGVEPTGEEPGEEALLLRAAAPVLERVFSGTLSPLGAYTDGQLEVYGSQKDQIKLDVIALVLWGA